MGSHTKKIFFWITLALLIHDFSDCCSYDEMVTGCRLAKSSSNDFGGLECLCGIGCQMEFPFKTQTECEAALKSGMSTDLDACDPNPCQNLGHCIQLKYGRFRCECVGTGFYGKTCQNECPATIGQNAFGIEQQQEFPLDCMNI